VLQESPRWNQLPGVTPIVTFNVHCYTLGVGHPFFGETCHKIAGAMSACKFMTLKELFPRVRIFLLYTKFVRKFYLDEMLAYKDLGMATKPLLPLRMLTKVKANNKRGSNAIIARERSRMRIVALPLC
jgi:hypothetical protein